MTDIRKFIDVINKAHQEGETHPDRYFKGISNKQKAQRDKGIEKNTTNDDVPSTHDPMTGDNKEIATTSKYPNKYIMGFNESKTALSDKLSHQWTLARENTFAVGEKTRQTADKDLWDGYKGKKKTNESVGEKLGDLISISTGQEDADLYVIRRGSLESVGKPTKEYNKEAYGITIKDRDLLDPQYLYYMLMYVHSSGYFKSKAKGSTNLVNMTKDDILNIPVK